jgi:lycopene cyclase domain-containing protein
MLESHYLYLCLNIITLIFPLLWSFEPKMYFIRFWRSILFSISIVAAFKIVWDIAFTYLGVWGFEPDYIIGIYFFNLPIEEVLFFITIPYASLFVYSSCKFYQWRLPLAISKLISLVLAIILFIVTIFNIGLWYTNVSFILSIILLVFSFFSKKVNDWLGIYWVSFFIVLLPFFLVNGVLTGSFTSKPVVWYNDFENLGIRVFTIPIEDLSYNFILSLAIVCIFELSNKKELKS